MYEYSAMFRDKGKRNDFLNKYENEITAMLHDGFTEMAIAHNQNLKRMQTEFSAFDR